MLISTVASIFAIAAVTLSTSMVLGADPVTLRAAVGDRMLIGVALMSRSLNNPAVASLAADQFNSLTAENEFKPASLQRQAGKFNFGPADALADFAQKNNMALIGHTLCWQNQTPGWMYSDASGKPLPREQALANLKTHIQTVVTHFKGKVRGWDVVNEALDDGDGYLRDCPAHRAIGDDFVIQAFKMAHEADPDVELYYNDYSLEMPAKCAKAVRLVRDLKAAGVRVDAVGSQAHWNIRWPSAEQLEATILALKGEGVKVCFTELDMDVLPNPNEKATADINATQASGANPYTKGCPPEVLRQQADRYAEWFSMFIKHRDTVQRVTFWGVGDGMSWLNSYPVRGRTNYALLWDRQLQPKPAFNAVLSVLQESRPK